MAISKVLHKYLSNGLADFPGLCISGTVPIKQDLINDVIGEWLESRRFTNKPKHSGTIGTAQPGLAPDSLLALLRMARIEAGPGVITVEFEIGSSTGS